MLPYDDRGAPRKDEVGNNYHLKFDERAVVRRVLAGAWLLLVPCPPPPPLQPTRPVRQDSSCGAAPPFSSYPQRRRHRWALAAERSSVAVSASSQPAAFDHQMATVASSHSPAAAILPGSPQAPSRPKEGAAHHFQTAGRPHHRALPAPPTACASRSLRVT